DGIWKVKYSICPNDQLFVERFFLKTDQIQCRYEKAFLSLDLKLPSDSDEEKKKRKDLAEIEFYIQGAIAAANDKNAVLAIELYNKADKLLNKWGKCGSC